MTSKKTYDIAGGDEYRIMSEKVTGVNKLTVYDLDGEPITPLPDTTGLCEYTTEELKLELKLRGEK